MKIKLTVFLSFFMMSGFIFAQPELDLKPNNIEYRDFHDRLETVYFINKGNQTLRIDSIYYSHYRYFLRFNVPSTFPIYITPGDSILMDCILSNYVNITPNEIRDTMYIVNNGIEPLEKLQIRIDFYDDDYKYSYLAGKVLRHGTDAPGVKVHLFYEGNYLLETGITNQSGEYSFRVPPGIYTLAAEADDAYLTFYEDMVDPFSATPLIAKKDSTIIADINLQMMSPSVISVSGSIFDSLSTGVVNRGVVVVKKGTHTPSKRGIGENKEIYSAMIQSDGTYKVENIIDPGSYYIFSLSDYYVPTYFNSNYNSPSFWQNADSVDLSGTLTGYSIPMPRDSSYGGGIIEGMITREDSIVVKGVMLYAQSVDNGFLYNYTLAKNEKFRMIHLPFGSYRLIAQHIGFEDAVSEIITLDSINTHISGINLEFKIVSVEGNPIFPETNSLSQNYPNPFNPATTINYSIAEGGLVTIKVYDILGKEVATIVNEDKSAGAYSVLFNGEALPSGVYLYRIQSGGYFESRKLLLVK